MARERREARQGEKAAGRRGEKQSRRQEKERLRAQRRNRPIPNWPLLALAAAGMALAGWLTATAWLGSSLPYCAEGSGCDVVQTSHWSTLLGLPIAFYGLLTYTALAWVALRVRRAIPHWSVAWMLALLGLGISLYLVAVSIFLIRATCLYCIASGLLMAVIFGVVLRQRPAELPGFSWVPWLAQTVGITALAVLVLHLHFLGVFHPAAAPEDPYLRGLAQHLEQVGVRFYGAYWCGHCKDQKALFGASARRLPYVECSPDGPESPPARACVTAGIEGYPTWVIADKRYSRVISPETLARYTGFEPRPRPAPGS